MAHSAYSQRAEVKVNLLAGAVVIFNPSVEFGINDSSAIAFDYVGAFAKSDYMGSGYPFILSMGIFEYRYYLRDRLFIGGDFGLDVFRMNKNLAPLSKNDHNDGCYDVGNGYILGATVGYKYPLNERWNIEASLSLGWHHSQHEGYTLEGMRIFELNSSSEWTIYKAGLYLGYRLWR